MPLKKKKSNLTPACIALKLDQKCPFLVLEIIL